MLTLKDFYADWCAPCQMIKPVLVEIEPDYEGRIEFERINVDENQGEAQKYSVMSIPTLVLEKDGQEIDRRMGAQGKAQLRSWLDGFLN